jgi:glycosyltransferase involved in cell wall biosynthesis
MNKSVSIIIPVKNGGAKFVKCISSISKVIQNYPGRVEIIIVDNGSKDNTIEISKSHHAKIIQKPELTIAGLRNYGARIAQNDVCAFVDADIVVDQNWLINAMKYFKDDNNVCVGASPFPPNDATWVSKTFHLLVEYRGKKSYSRKWLATANMFVKREVFWSLRGFNEDLKTCEDVDFGYRLSSQYGIIYDRDIVCYHLGEISTLKELFFKELWRGKDNFQSLRLHQFTMKEIPSVMIPLFHILICMSLVILPLINIKYFYIALILLLLPSLVISSIVVKKLGCYTQLLKLFIVYFIYTMARGLSLLYNKKEGKP